MAWTGKDLGLPIFYGFFKEVFQRTEHIISNYWIKYLKQLQMIGHGTHRDQRGKNSAYLRGPEFKSWAADRMKLFKFLCVLLSFSTEVKVKANLILEQCMKAQRRSRSIDLFFL
jgi:hypothetical protein